MTLLMIGGLSGCGQKGALYLPPPEKAAPLSLPAPGPAPSQSPARTAP